MHVFDVENLKGAVHTRWRPEAVIEPRAGSDHERARAGTRDDGARRSLPASQRRSRYRRNACRRHGRAALDDRRRDVKGGPQCRSNDRGISGRIPRGPNRACRDRSHAPQTERRPRTICSRAAGVGAARRERLWSRVREPRGPRRSPAMFVAPVERTLAQCMSEGTLAGYPVIGLKAVLLHGETHARDSTPMAFECATRDAFKTAFAVGQPRLLEPIMQVFVTTPGEHLGSIIGDLQSRRGSVTRSSIRTNVHAISAHVPLANMFNCVNAARSLSRGLRPSQCGSATMRQCRRRCRQKSFVRDSCRPGSNLPGLFRVIPRSKLWRPSSREPRSLRWSFLRRSSVVFSEVGDRSARLSGLLHLVIAEAYIG
jgi:Elongation factor G, domain IV/Elongation factor G C-terminus